MTTLADAAVNRRRARGCVCAAGLRVVGTLLLLGLVVPVAFAQSAETPPTDADIDPWTSHVTADWHGLRPWLATKGFTFDVSYASSYQALVSGTGDQDFGYGGKADGFFNVDTARMGLWNGGGVRSHLEYRHGPAPSNLGGALFSQNTAQLWPVNAPGRVVATSLYVTQRVGTRTQLFIGKINPIDTLASDPLFGGWGSDRFMNLIFVAPPNGLVPPVLMGAIATIDTHPVSWSAWVFDPDDRTSDYFPGDLFGNGVNLFVTGTHRSRLGGRATSYSVSAAYSTAHGTDYSALPPDISTSTKSGAYNISFQFTHNLQEHRGRPAEVWSVYVKAAIADGNPNYVQASVIAGVAGRALFLKRPRDRFGLGAFYYNLSDQLQDTAAASIQLHDESAVEGFYICALNRWLFFGADIQYFDPVRSANKRGVAAALRSRIDF